MGILWIYISCDHIIEGDFNIKNNIKRLVKNVILVYDTLENIKWGIYIESYRA